MFRSLLIANRGEIACRVMRTAKRMGIRSIAVFSEADRNALHVRMADEAYPIGPAPARDSYLRADHIIAAARRSNAEAIHPGYGFLSENADFAEACAEAGIVFVGPPPAAIRAMGSKSAAKALMAQAGVPLVPGYHGEDQDPALLSEQAALTGYPVLIKASAGGGGKGMRIVERAQDFAENLALAQGEARASFGDDRMLIERYLTRPRHIEIQVFADSHGNVVHLFERDCSIQRRHQKVLEEAPAPGMSASRRASMGRAACDAARAIAYQGAGTVEFIAEGDDFFFMEMNTRLQVEHPVTEMITGQDLVEWQLRVASGETLPLLQDKLAISGHAIEARIYAEDPARDYMPGTGVLHHLRPPAESAHVRVDSGIGQGDAITIHYDPMIAKLIVWDLDRHAACHRLQAALDAYEMTGVTTNLSLLRRIASHPDFLAGAFDTGFLSRHEELFQATETAPPSLAFAAAIAQELAARADAANSAARKTGDPHSPWALATAWRLNGDGYQDFVLRHAGTDYTLRAHPHPGGGFDLELDGGRFHAERGDDSSIWLDGARHRAPVTRIGSELTVLIDGTAWKLDLIDRMQPEATEGAGGDRLVAPMPGRVVSLHTEPGARVSRGDVLLVLEAMKVQMRLTAPRDGIIALLRAKPGDLVEEGTELVGFVTEAAP
jgi:3-methylcrotonyl-CoA carboxylase alpha subunit